MWARRRSTMSEAWASGAVPSGGSNRVRVATCIGCDGDSKSTNIASVGLIGANHRTQLAHRTSRLLCGLSRTHCARDDRTFRRADIGPHGFHTCEQVRGSWSRAGRVLGPTSRRAGAGVRAEMIGSPHSPAPTSSHGWWAVRTRRLSERWRIGGPKTDACHGARSLRGRCNPVSGLIWPRKSRDRFAMLVNRVRLERGRRSVRSVLNTGIGHALKAGESVPFVRSGFQS